MLIRLTCLLCFVAFSASDCSAWDRWYPGKMLSSDRCTRVRSVRSSRTYRSPGVIRPSVIHRTRLKTSVQAINTDDSNESSAKPSLPLDSVT